MRKSNKNSNSASFAMEKKVRVGIIGSGGIACATHIPNYKKIDGVELVACADIDLSAAKRASKEFNIPRFYREYEEMLKKENLDAVSVCTPNAFHKDPAIAAMKAGAHVLTEKPMAGKLSDAKRMYEASKKYGKILIVGFQTRFRIDLNALRQLVNEGELGDVYYTRALSLRRWGVPVRPTFIDKKVSGGGPLLDIGCYAVDMAMYVLGFPAPRKAYAVTYDKICKDPTMAKKGGWGGQWRVEDFTVEDNAFGFVKFRNGMTMLLETNWASFSPSDAFNLILLGTKGGAQLEPFELYKDVLEKRVVIKPHDEIHQPDIYEQRIFKFVESVRKGKPLFSPAIEGLKVQAILDAMYRSAAQKKEVEVEWDF
jgi:predicted dehydrogenase